MSEELKRVGFTFQEEGGAKFVKTLKEVNSAISDNTLEFKKAQAQWDKNTPTADKLKFQIENLGKAIELQKDKVQTLRAEISNLENAEESDTKTNRKNQEQLAKKRKELEKTELKIISYTKKIESMQEQLNNTGKKIEEFGSNIEKNGQKIEEASKKVSAFSIAIGTALLTSAKTAIDFEDAFTGVEKTVDGTAEQMAELKQGIRNMSKEIPSSTTEISAVAEAAGQLGIQTDNVLSFTRTMIDMGNATNLSAEEAATTLARFANVTRMSQTDFNKLGSVIVALGNNFATTESEIAQMGMNLASAGTQVGMSQSQIMALATALSSVGLEAQAGGTAFSKVMINMQLAVEKGGESLKDFATVAGMSSKDFQKAFKKDATSAIMKFVEGLSKSDERGKSAIKVLDDMEIKETRLRDALLRSANASNIFSQAITLGSEALKDNTALTNEANKRYETLKSKLIIIVNKIKDLGITIGNKLMPYIDGLISNIEKLTKWLGSLTDKSINWIVNIGLTVTAIAPLISILGKLTSGIGGVINSFGKFINVLEVASGTATSTSTAVNCMASIIKGVTSPIGIACTIIGTAIAGIAISAQDTTKATKTAFSNIGDAATDFITGIDNAQSHLNAFNSELFVSSEEQQKLQEQMNEIQKGITNICKTAADERRGYTQEEITKLDEYFTKLRELNQREIEIQQQIAGAITQQAVTNSETFKGNLEEYKIRSQEWIKTAEDQKNKIIESLNNQTIEEIAILNTKYTTEEQRQTEEYKKEYERIVAQKEEKIAQANEEVAKISEVFANGYLERNKQEDGFYNTLQEYMNKQEELTNSHNEQIRKLKNNELWYVTDTAGAIRDENNKYGTRCIKICQKNKKKN